MKTITRQFSLALAAALLLPACVTPRPWTKAEKVMLGVSLTATGANMYEAKKAFDRGCEEMNPFLEWNPFIGATLSELGSIAFVHYCPTITLPIFGELETRIYFLGFKAAINTTLAIHDLERDKRGFLCVNF